MNTSKKIISILMCVLMLMSVVSVSVSAASAAVFDIECNRLERWLVTRTVPLMVRDFTVPDGFKVESVQSKDKETGTVLEETDRYIGGRTYTIGIVFSRNGGAITQIQLNNTVIKVNGSVVPSSNITLVEGKVLVTVEKYIEKQYVTTFELESEGYKPGAQVSGFTIDETYCVGLRIKDYYFRDIDANSDLSASATFTAGKNYALYVDLYVDEDYDFSDKFDVEKTVAIDLPIKSKALKYDGTDENGRYISLKFELKSPVYVDSVRITLGGYEYGNEVGDIKVKEYTDGAEFYGGSVYYTGGYSILVDGEGGKMNGVSDEATVFDYGTQYYLGVKLISSNGGSLANLTADGIMLEDYGYPVKFQRISDEEVTVYFRLPVLSKKDVESVEIALGGYEYGKKIAEISVAEDTEGAVFSGTGLYAGSFIVMDDGGFVIDETATFEYGKQYGLLVVLSASEGYTLDNLGADEIALKNSDVTCQILGQSADEITVLFGLPILVHSCADYLEHKDAIAKDCINDGCIEHYICKYPSCGKIYLDLAATQETTQDDVTIDALGHNFTVLPKTEASCSGEGRSEGFRVCRSCNGKYSLTDEITPLTDEYVKSLIIPVLEHTYDDSCDTECNGCGYFRDIAHTYDNACDAECNVCKATRTPATHKGGTATCTEKAKCSVCGEAYGSVNKNNHKSLTTLKAVAATYKATGLTEGKKCADCGKITVAQKTVAKKVLGKVKGLKTKTVKLASGTKTTLTLAWTKVADAQKYEVYQQRGKKWKKIGTTSKTTLTVKKLKANKSYKFKVRAIRSDAKGAYSSVFTGKTVPLTPAVTLKAGKKALTASWKTVANITGYEVQASTSKKFTSKTTKKVSITKAKTTKTTIKKLSKGKKYYVKVRAYKTVGKTKVYSAWSSVKTVKVK